MSLKGEQLQEAQDRLRRLAEERSQAEVALSALRQRYWEASAQVATLSLAVEVAGYPEALQRQLRELGSCPQGHAGASLARRGLADPSGARWRSYSWSEKARRAQSLLAVEPENPSLFGERP